MSKREFSTTVRMPYQDAISLILKTMDYHQKMSILSTDKKYKDFHNKQYFRLKESISKLTLVKGRKLPLSIRQAFLYKFSAG